jgi:hypothetical protein
MSKIVALAAALVVLVGCSESEPTGDPSQMLKREIHGYSAPIGVMMGVDETAYWVKNAMIDWRQTSDEDVPTKIELIPRKSSCKFEPPKDNEIVGKAMVNAGGMTSGVFATTRENIADKANQYIKNRQNKGEDASVPVDSAGDVLSVVDVIVTENSKPVYLVLSHAHDVLFIIHLAPDAKLSRIALVGQGTAGVANVSSEIPVESLDGTAIAACKVAPLRRPADHWILVEDAKDNPVVEDEMPKVYGFASRYASWFRSNFKVSFEPNLAGASFTSHILIGPAPKTPETRVVFKSISESVARISTRDVVYAGLHADYREKKTKMIVEAATKAAGGNLASITSQE